MFPQPFLFEDIVVINRCIQEITRNFKLIALPGLQFVGKGRTASAQKRPLKQVPPLQCSLTRHKAAVYPQQKGVFLESGEKANMEGAQLGEGFHAQPRCCIEKLTGAADLFFSRLGDGIEKQKARQFRIYDLYALILHRFPVFLVPSRQGKIHFLRNHHISR
jgi:hypothetical protein